MKNNFPAQRTSLPQGEGTPFDAFGYSTLLWQILRAGLFLWRNAIPPLPGGEGRGEGEQLQTALSSKPTLSSASTRQVHFDVRCS